MMKHLVFSVLLCSILMMSPLPCMVSAVDARMTHDWQDGDFQGTWSVRNGTLSGILHGSLNQGRNSDRGSFTGEWNSSDDTIAGQMQGMFRGSLLLGRCTVSITGETSRFIGMFKHNDTQFNARIMTKTMGVIDVVGMYEASFLPRLTGVYGVGVKTIHLVDENRSENFTVNDTTDVREFMVQLWYPINKTVLEPRAEYMDAPTFQWLKHRSPIPLVTIPDDAYFFIRPHIRNDTMIASGVFPLVIFSPGYDGVYQIYTSFIEDLVSHGFIVASMNHPYVSGITVFPDSRTVGLASVPDGAVARSAFFNMSLRTIVEDAKFLVDTLTGMNASDPDFSGHFDLSRIGMYGHSFGGANTAVCCYEDPRITAGLTLEGVFYPQFTPGNITRPFLMMFAEARLTNDSTIQYLWDHTTSDTFKMSIKGSTHYAYTDVGLLLTHLVPLIPIKILGFGKIPPKRMVNITRTYVTVYFEVYLKGAPVETLLGLSSSFAEVRFEYKFG